jgi:hypothetical protein
MNLEKRVVVANLDGTDQREIFHVPDAMMMSSMSVSPDDTSVAVGVEAEDLRDQTTAFLAFVDIRTGREVHRIPAAELFAVGVPGTPGAGPWLADSSAVEVYGVQHRDSIYQLKARARPDGTVVSNGRTLLSLDPSGRRGAGVIGEFVGACGELGFAERAIRVTVEPGGETVGDIAIEGRAVAFWDWSPDGSELLFRTFALETGSDGRPCFAFDESAPWYVWSASGIRTVSDRKAVLAQWQGTRYVEFACTAKPIPPSTQPPCGSGPHPPPFTFLIAGQRIDEVQRGTVIGFID